MDTSCQHLLSAFMVQKKNPNKRPDKGLCLGSSLRVLCGVCDLRKCPPPAFFDVLWGNVHLSGNLGVGLPSDITLDQTIFLVRRQFK